MQQHELFVGILWAQLFQLLGKYTHKALFADSRLVMWLLVSVAHFKGAVLL